MSEKKAEITQARREYLKKWRAANKEKIREYNERFWLKKADELRKKTEDE